MLERVIDHLRRLVACESTNPPRTIGVDHGVLVHARKTLEAAGFSVRAQDLGGGSVNLLATRGAPRTLVNCHLDTVPADGGWERNPFDLLVESDRAIGLGACDIKGAAACILAACERTDGDAAILFTTDEEAGSSACVRSFLEEGAGAFAGVVVSEPTGCRAVLEHRGIVSCQVEFRGQGGHASLDGSRSALHDAVIWGARALEAATVAGSGGDGWRLNIGQVEGGTKPNMVASSARVRFGVRPPPGSDDGAMLAAIRAAAPAGSNTTWDTRFQAAALGETPPSRLLADTLGVETAPGVDFWTEAALFAKGGLPAVVFGPGSIAQAHAPGEFVAVADLEFAAGVYSKLFGGMSEGA